MEWLYAKGIPIEAQFLYQKALDLTHKGRDEVALKYLRQSVIIAPRYTRAIFEMGNCFARLGHIPEALERYDKASHLDPDAVEIRLKKELLSRQDRMKK
jgi:tetratricopeptide (TPR) repeat protein